MNLKYRKMLEGIFEQTKFESTGKVCYILGIIDSHGAVHSVAVENPIQIHEDFWPVPYKRWRFIPHTQEFITLEDKVTNPEYVLTTEEREHVNNHLRRKGYMLNENL